jgi:hypothetical protein
MLHNRNEYKNRARGNRHQTAGNSMQSRGGNNSIDIIPTTL